MELGVYGLYEERLSGGFLVAFVIAKGRTQLKYICVEYPMVAHVEMIEWFERHMLKRYDYTVDEAARRFLKTGPVTMGQCDETVKAILEDLSGYSLLY